MRAADRPLVEPIPPQRQPMGVNQPSDRELLDGIDSQDLRALGALYDRHASLLAHRLRKGGASIEEAEDVIQETFLDVWRSSGSYRGDGPVAAWLWGIAWRKFSMLVRAEIRLRDRQSRAGRRRGIEPSSEADWAAAMDAAGALEELSDELRSAFRAVVIDGLSIAEVARRLGIPEGTVKSRVHRARRSLIKELQ